MQNFKTVARRAGMGIAVAGVAAGAAVAPANAAAPVINGVGQSATTSVDYQNPNPGYDYTWYRDASGATHYSYDSTPAWEKFSASYQAPAQQAPAEAASYQAPTQSYQAPAQPAAASAGLSTQSYASANTSGVVGLAMAYQGSGYVWGGTTPGAWDCSGFVQWVFAQKGINLPRTAAAQGAAGTPTANPVPGDLVIQNGGGHVGIYLGNGMMISALNPTQGVEVHAVSAMPVSYFSHI